MVVLLNTGKGVGCVKTGVDSMSVELEYRVEPPACELCTACMVV